VIIEQAPALTKCVCCKLLKGNSAAGTKFNNNKKAFWIRNKRKGNPAF
jgi:hypothetical protein